jgi:DNA topoisomerase-1
MRNLVIVESPAKAKTIEKFLGKDYSVVSSFGHVRDLPRKDISIDIENNFKPNYVVSTDKKKIVTELRKKVKEAETVWLASDEDREGEAIAWHLFEVLKLKNKDTKRIVFNEITKKAILGAIEKPKDINLKLVDAQQARRVLDRIVGYELSPVLWRKVKSANSAGRVQSVAVRLIVEREREINNFNSESSYKVSAIFDYNGNKIKAELASKIKTIEEARELLKKFQQSDFSINDVTKKDGTRKPAAPFTTSSLQQEANRKMGYSVAQTMVVAQQLYEAGLITYMRTDSTNLSDSAIEQAKTHIAEKFGEEYLKIRSYQTKSKNAQEAHEAIRPSDLNKDKPLLDDNQQARLYKLIYNRTIASQMSEAVIEKTNIYITASGDDHKFVAKGEVIKFDGFMKVYIESTDNEASVEDSGLLPKVNVGDCVVFDEIKAREVYSKHPARYTEASLVRKLEELGIGRPSTYAPTISTIQKRNYVLNESRDGVEREYNLLTVSSDNFNESKNIEITGAEKKKMFPTDVGMVVTDYLIEHFDNIMDYRFTADIESQFDLISSGDRQWQEVMKEFYNPFHVKIEDAKKAEGTSTGERHLGVDPKSEKNLYVKVGRFGPMAQLGDISDEEGAEKPKFASLLKGQSIETISFEDAMELFKLPRILGTNADGKEIKANIGRFGPYVQLGSTFASIPKKDVDYDVMSIDLQQAIVLIEEKIEKDKKKTVNVFKKDEDEVKVLNGRFGPYISYKKKNYKIPKDVKAEDLKLEDCVKIIEETPTKKKVKKTKK